MRQAKILLVEDEADLISVNKNHLEKQGYLVSCAQTISRAWELVIQDPPDLIILDVLLPDGSGYDFCNKVREMTTAPIIYLTCLSESSQIIYGLDCGGDDYLVKPYDLDVLSARIAAQLRRNGLQGSARIDLPPLHINLQTGKVQINEQNVLLSQKELQLLSFMVLRAGQEISAEELYEQVWGEKAFNSTHTVTAHISNLRKKLQLGYDSPFEIRATKNSGYIFLKVVW